jgi:hypothetical protein
MYKISFVHHEVVNYSARKFLNYTSNRVCKMGLFILRSNYRVF